MRPDSARTARDARTEAEAGDLAHVPRPREQNRLLGHAHAEAAFAGALAVGRLHHAWLIGGPTGIGKATLAYRVARRLVADPRTLPSPDSLDVPEDHPAARQVTALSHPNLVALRRVQAPGAKTLPTRISVDAAREALALFGATAGGEGGWRVCIVDSAEDLNANSANALLKMIEEPPPRAIFLIVSHAPGRLLPTIRSRCRALALRALPEADVRAVIEGFPAPFPRPEPAALARAVSLCEGSVARAVALLDPATAAVEAEVSALLAGLPEPDGRRVLKLAETLAGRDAEPLLATVLDAMQRHVAAEIDRRKGEGPASLLALVEAAERIASTAREAAIYNLDRRPLVLAAFRELSGATRSPSPS
ncbi:MULTISPECIES: DNA polymerase III subunit delta' [Methylorubrum]|uniref:DNA polymerase III subunit delta' n=1 Tax=Methylorubrum TaxID=2282523 RepID=UPI00209EF9AE|nr:MULTISPECIES: DNA polymerase III subunit delta' [Methylorubrum]MCP1550024.1 DNA polymerase-3 subunit delta' [Methylorubrum zatmanii]MCP1553362.1 DNA polymerase-3 subunit delta' [Methylorubrum extorquens]MCP1580326.1 DNA polymerase-3 subunit delta' [Methylorubrum extorquens]